MDKNTRLGIALGTVFALLTGQVMFAYADSLTRQLQFGMTGADVGMLQTFLARDASVYPEGKITNYFGALTRAAVMRFQSKNGISTIGRVGPQTLAAINAQMSGGVPVTVGNVAPISGVTANNMNGSVTIAWTTPVPTRGTVYYSTIPLTAYENDNSVTINGTPIAESSSTYGTMHSVMIPTTTPATTYYFSIYTTDQNGKVDMTWPATFRTN
jgi:peptidoglycan hydrolase-like protein with peptidoglycan-binding domain